jgi:hypothetical protein
LVFSRIFVKKMGKGWEMDGKWMGKGWEMDAKRMGNGWEKDGKGMGEIWGKYGESLGERMGEESSGLEALSWGERDVSCTSIVVSTKDKRWAEICKL